MTLKKLQTCFLCHHDTLISYLLRLALYSFQITITEYVDFSFLSMRKGMLIGTCAKCVNASRGSIAPWYALDTDQSTAEVAIRQRCEQIGYQGRPSRRRQQQAKTTPREALSAPSRKARAEEAREENQQEERQQADGQTGRGKTSDRLESW